MRSPPARIAVTEDRPARSARSRCLPGTAASGKTARSDSYRRLHDVIHCAKSSVGDDLAGGVQRHPARELDPERLLRLVDAGRLDALDQAREDRDSGAAALEHSRRPLDDGDLDPAPVEQVADQQARDRPADDDGTPDVGRHPLSPPRLPAGRPAAPRA